MDGPRRVLALMPHPDDMEILAGGTLIRLIAVGWEVHVATMTAGDKGTAEYGPAEIAAIRRDEARRGAETIGAATYTCLEFEDVDYDFDRESRRRVVEMVRTVDPQLVITTPPDDYMVDHEITSRLVRNACFNGPMPNFHTGGDAPPTSGLPHLYYAEALGGHNILGAPVPHTRLVDVSAEIDQKLDALKRHASQRNWLRKQHGMDDYIESVRARCAELGARAGVAYAEGFCQHLGHPHPLSDLLGEELPARP